MLNVPLAQALNESSLARERHRAERDLLSDSDLLR